MDKVEDIVGRLRKEVAERQKEPDWFDEQLSQDIASAADLIQSQQALIEEMREALMSIQEITDTTIACPQGGLWNYGTTPTRKDEIEWEAKIDLAREIKDFIPKALSQKE